MRFLLLLGLLASANPIFSQNTHLHNVPNRPATTLAGNWHYIIDPYETGFRNHRNWTPYDEKEAATTSSAAPYYTNRKQVNRWDRIEYDFDLSPTLNVPGDWNHQQAELLYYEGSVWYKTDFKYNLPAGRRLLLHFGAANYRADVYLNGKKAGMHEGGYDPFHFDVSGLVQAGGNFLVVRVDNRRERDRVPGMTTDWWNYGGLTRDVSLVEVPETFVSNFYLQENKEKRGRATGWVQLDGSKLGQKITVSIPELKVNQTVTTDATGRAFLDLDISKSKRWYPERPKLYDVVFKAETDETRDRIGFRTIETRGQDLILNGKPLFLRGICMHEEVPTRMGRAHSREDAQLLLGWAKELNCNFVRLAHYPHNEHMVRLADEIGLLVWDEVPVYWGINYENPATYAQAESQIRAMVERDKNRASVIVWSVANETPREDPKRLEFLNNMTATVRGIDNSRLVSAALDRTEDKAKNYIRITDPYAATSDVVSTNEYLGWYGSTPDRCRIVTWDLQEHNKPFFVSEFGADALHNYRADSLTIWTEDYQEWLYREQLEMLKKIPSWRGVTPWILADFRAPRRNLPGIQDGWNRKGLISSNGYKKRAWYVLKAFYDEMERKWGYKVED